MCVCRATVTCFTTPALSPTRREAALRALAVRRPVHQPHPVFPPAATTCVVCACASTVCQRLGTIASKMVPACVWHAMRVTYWTPHRQDASNPVINPIARTYTHTHTAYEHACTKESARAYFVDRTPIDWLLNAF